MLQNYRFPVKNVIYITSDNSRVKVIYEDNTFNETTPDDQVVLSWVNIDTNTISSYVGPQEDPDLDRTQPGYVGISEETPAE
jgi:hypothetical protein